MPADTFSAGLGYLVMGTGNDNNSWGTNANASVFQVFEDAISGTLTSSITGGTLDLSTTPPPAGPSLARYHRLNFTGSLLSNQTVLVPNLTKTWLVSNNTSGAFILKMKTPSGTGILIPQGMNCIVSCFGGDILMRIGARTGEIFTHAGTSVPAGSAVCNHAALSRADFNELFAVIQTTWGAGDTFTTFNIPGLQDTNRFLRSSGGSLTVGTTQASQNASHFHTGSVTATGTTSTESNSHTHSVSGTTTGQSADHTHTVSVPQPTFSAQGGGLQTTFNTSTVTSSFTSNDHTHNFSATSGAASTTHTHTVSATGSFSSDPSGGTEARPEAAVVLMCIWL